MKARLLTLAVLTATLLCAALTGGRAEAAYCPYYNWCVDNYRSCMSWCSGDPTCEYWCKQDYTACICSNCGSCPPGGLP